MVTGNQTTAGRQPLPTAPSRQYRARSLMDAAGERLRSLPLGARLRAWGRAAYHAAWMLQTRGRGLACTLPSGEVIRVLPGHRYLSWNPVEYAAFRAAAAPGMVALDVGANVGAYAVLLGQWVGAAGRVYAFEPSPAAFDGLVRHIGLNAQAGVVTAVPAAVADQDGTGALIVAGTAGESRLAGGAESDAAVRVQTLTIDGFCAREAVQPSFIKIDVEGAELAVLRGARETIRRAGGRLALFVELHPSIWRLLGVTRADVESELERQGLAVAPLTSDDPWTVEGMVVRLVRR
jgi:FkbM family methyltransferase